MCQNIAMDEQQGFIVLGGFGKHDFADVNKQGFNGRRRAGKTARYYQQAMQAIFGDSKDWHQWRQKPLSQVTMMPLLRREMGLFSEVLPYIGVTMTPDLETLWQDLQSDIIQQVIAQPRGGAPWFSQP